MANQTSRAGSDALGWATHKAEVLERLLHLFVDPGRVEWVARTILEIALQAVRSGAGSFLLLDENAGELVFMAARGPVAADVQGVRVPKDKGIAGACLMEGRPIVISDVGSDPRFYKELSEALGYDTKSLIAVPVFYKGERLGVLELLNREEGGQYSKAEMDLLSRVAYTAGNLLYLSRRLDAGE